MGETVDGGGAAHRSGGGGQLGRVGGGGAHSDRMYVEGEGGRRRRSSQAPTRGESAVGVEAGGWRPNRGGGGGG